MLATYSNFIYLFIYIIIFCKTHFLVWIAVDHGCGCGVITWRESAYRKRICHVYTMSLHRSYMVGYFIKAHTHIPPSQLSLNPRYIYPSSSPFLSRIPVFSSLYFCSPNFISNRFFSFSFSLQIESKRNAIIKILDRKLMNFSLDFTFLYFFLWVFFSFVFLVRGINGGNRAEILHWVCAFTEETTEFHTRFLGEACWVERYRSCTDRYGQATCWSRRLWLRSPQAVWCGLEETTREF